MTFPNRSEELVDAALKAMLATPGPDDPPTAIIDRLRQQIAERISPRPATRLLPPELSRQIAWRQLVVCVVAMVTCGWIGGFHKSLFSQVAGREVSPQGTVTLFYTDGRMRVVANEDS